MTAEEIRQLVASIEAGSDYTATAATKESSHIPDVLVPGRLISSMFANPAFTAAVSSVEATSKKAFGFNPMEKFSDLMSSGILHRNSVAGAGGRSPEAEETATPDTPAVPPSTYGASSASASPGSPPIVTSRSSLIRSHQYFKDKTHSSKVPREPPPTPVSPSSLVFTTTTTSSHPALPHAHSEQRNTTTTTSFNEAMTTHQILESSESKAMEDGRSETPKGHSPIRISTIAWKRRGGMGKFSSTSAWERRRIELQGSKILYYLRDASEEETATTQQQEQIPGMDTTTDSLISSIRQSDLLHPTPRGAAQDQLSDGVVVVPKRATWLEQAANTLLSSSEDPTAPRGYIDLAKEKATVAVSFGDSGAPSPFALSIKIRGETKWKLCFDYHKTQMEWLAAISDVVVQTSVDAYNGLLVQASDPANISDGNLMFHPPMLVGKPPTKDTGYGGQRLWMTEQYIVSNFLDDTQRSPRRNTDESDNLPDVMEDNNYSTAKRTRQKETHIISASTTAAENYSKKYSLDETKLAEIEDSASKTWIVPEKNLLYLLGVINVALVYARASSTSMEGFWYLAVLANVGIYLCLMKNPDWRMCARLAVAAVSTTSSVIHLSSNKENEDSFVNLDVAERSILDTNSTVDPPSTDYIPVAGCSTVRLENPTDPPTNSKGEYFAGWRCPPGESLSVRSHGYLETKGKIPSPGELYDCVAVDIFESPMRYPDMAPRVKLPEVVFDDDDCTKTWRTPDLFIITICLPTDPPKMGRTSSDGGGYTITMYYKMKQATRYILKRVTADGYDPASEKIDDPQKSRINAVRLLEEWCRRAPTDHSFQSRFKIVPNAHNLKEIGLPNWIARYNGKPFLIKRPGQTGFLFNHSELGCMVFEVSLHPFPYLAKQAICFMKESYFKKILVTFGFVIEGRNDDEVKYSLFVNLFFS